MMGDYHINIFYSDEDRGYIADIPDLDSCSAFGQTPEQALAEVEQAKKGVVGRGGSGRQTHSGPPLSPRDLPGFSLT